MLTEKEYKEILRYYKTVSRDVLSGRRECQRLPADQWHKTAINRLEGRLRAIKHICRILELPVPNEDSMVV